MAPVLGYFPEAIVAAQGDVVKFVFKQKNHTVTQSTFDEPCKKMEGGMDSNFIANPEGKAGPEFEWEMTVPTTDPLCESTTLSAISHDHS
jgi:plastocyanin